MSWLTCDGFYQNTGFLLRFSCDFALKSSLFLVALFLLYQAVRHLPSAFRHFLLSVSFVCLSLMPFWLVWVPTWQLPFLSAPAIFTGGHVATPGIWLILLLGIWLIGFGVVMARLAAGLWLTRRLRRESLVLDDPGWMSDLQLSSRRLGVSDNIAVLVNHRLGAAICAGIIRPCIILPAVALDWSDEQRTAILHHELGHIRRRDNLTNVFALAVCAVYWFNPLVWWAAARLKLCREAACDDLVLGCGTRPSRYVSYLLQATSTPPSRLISVTLSQISVLKKRVLTILDPRVNRETLGPVQVVACSFLAAAVLTSLAAWQLWIIPSFPAGLAEKLGLTQMSAARMVSQVLFSVDGLEGRGRVQRNRQGRLQGLPPGFVPAGIPPIISGGYPTQMVTIHRPGDTAVPVGIPESWKLPIFALGYGSSGPYASQSSTAVDLGSQISPDTEPPDSGGGPLGPPDNTSPDLSLTRLSLGTLGGGSSLANDINEAGLVVGASTDGLGNSQPFIWSKSEGMSNLPCPSSDCQALDISNSGKVLVVATDQTAAKSASYLWSPDDTLTDIGTLGGESTRALQVNDHGQITGTSENLFGIESTFFWSSETGMVNLGGSKAVAMNEQGQVAASAASYAFFWDPAKGSFQRIGDLNVKAQPLDMNNKGEVVGYAQIGQDSQPKAFYWNATNGMTEIQFPGAPSSSCAFRINDAGEVLAVAKDLTNGEQTYSWHAGQEAQEQSLPDFLLPKLDWDVMSASSSSLTLIGSNLPSSRLAEELAKVDFAASEAPTILPQPVKMNGRGQIAGNLFRTDLSQVEAVVWEIRLPKVEESIQGVLKQLPQGVAGFSVRAELQTALSSLADNDYQAAITSLSTFLEIVPALDSSIPPSSRNDWVQTITESLNRISHFTTLK